MGLFSLFCDHDWERESGDGSISLWGGSHYCRKCGASEKHNWEFDYTYSNKRAKHGLPGMGFETSKVDVYKCTICNDRYDD